MKGHALFYLVPVTLIYLSSTEGLTLEKTADLGDDTTEVPQDDSIADNVVRVKNGIRFENGVLKYDILTSSTVGPDESEKIVFDYEVEALKVMEMLTGDDSNSSSPLFQSGNVTIEEYHSYKQMQIFARDIASQYPDLVANYSLGKSVQGRELIAFKIRPNITNTRPVGIPMVKYVGNMHGDESVGREMILAMVQYLVTNYGIETRVTELLDSSEIHLVPSMNPDGFEAVTRGNYNNVDLNRAFPGEELMGEEERLTENREPEVVAVIDWILEHPWVVSINFHDGAVVANYPWDKRGMTPWSKSDRFRKPSLLEEGSSSTTDNSEFVMLAELYSSKHTTMGSQDPGCGKFERGITNGADWYEISGGMQANYHFYLVCVQMSMFQDFNYLFTNCMEITLELSCVKKPLSKMLQPEWEKNMEPMMAYLEVAKSLLHGVVTDASGEPVEAAHIKIQGREKDVLTTEMGEYWRVLSPGTYTLQAIKDDMASDEVTVTIASDWRARSGQRLDLSLSKPLTRSQTTEPPPTTTTTTTTTTEPTPVEGTNLYILPGICINISLSFTPIKGCTEN